MITVKKRLTKEEKENRVTKTLTCDRRVWDEAGAILAEVGFSRSRFVEMVLRDVVRSKKVPFADMTSEIFQEVADVAVRKAIKKYKE